MSTTDHAAAPPPHAADLIRAAAQLGVKATGLDESVRNTVREKVSRHVNGAGKSRAEARPATLLTPDRAARTGAAA
ncbi:hypothetical protein SMD44_p10025 (plasmid) [Streptomyces alboflavus]|uniref:Uncharacterized protein n=1 Tax=Streptomyces alboflavus TaxID=67267 RepID=A0A291W3E6_9ACTN|nr:hypothetical protein [Streptomyces alboflavus]ATM24524.1 hypothetical protein SMD44_p10025 [Streptomyces alboflavus]